MFGLSGLVTNLIGAGVLVAAIGGGALYLHHKWYTEGAASVQVKWDEAVVKQSAATVKLNTQIANDWAANVKVLSENLDSITTKYNDAAKRLRDSQRANTRVADAAARACKGATGAELSRPDAGFSEWEAARAERIRVKLGKCYKDIDDLRTEWAKALGLKYTPPVYLPDPVEPDWTK